MLVDTRTDQKFTNVLNVFLCFVYFFILDFSFSPKTVLNSKCKIVQWSDSGS